MSQVAHTVRKSSDLPPRRPRSQREGGCRAGRFFPFYTFESLPACVWDPIDQPSPSKAASFLLEYLFNSFATTWAPLLWELEGEGW